MQNTKKLLSINNLKKYFPIAKTSLFQKNTLYVRANEDISLDIYEGETIGVVGESGCGKSTLGRTLLQLYKQTAGTTMYYGKTLDEMTPGYVEKTLKYYKKYLTRYEKADKNLAHYSQEVEAVGEDKADFYLLQNRNLAECERKTCLDNIVKIVGGFFAYDPGDKGKELLLQLYHYHKEKNEGIAKARNEIVKKKGHFDEEDHAWEKDVLSSGKMMELEQKIQAVRKELEELRKEYGKREDFAKYEAMLDQGVDISRLTYNEQRGLRKDLQIIFQDPYSSLNPRFTIGQIIEEGLVTHNFYKSGSEKMRQHIVDTMLECGLQEYMLYRYPHQFSGGQRQRISIARALAVRPKFIVCDECVSALDVSIQSQIINLLQELKEKEKLTYMFISHDLSVVRYISDRICVMYLGNVVELAEADLVFKDPRHPYTVALLSSIPTTDVNSAKKERIILEGNIPSPIKPPSGCKFHTRCYMACDKCKRVPPPLTEIEEGHFVACHFPEKKMDEKGNYLFELPSQEGKGNLEKGNSDKGNSGSKES